MSTGVFFINFAFAGVCFYQAVTVQDPDDSQKEYRFDLADPVHGACFNIGIGPDGSPLISWSNLHALYELPDGTKWAEHGFFHDAEDMVSIPTVGRAVHRMPIMRYEAVLTFPPSLIHTITLYLIKLPIACVTGRFSSEKGSPFCQA